MKYEKYIHLFQYSRYKTRKVQVGNIEIGGNNPIRVQSMTSTNTLNTEETIHQSLRIIKAGGELVRITAQGEREAENLENIKKGIRAKGFETPIAADIHFSPKAAFVAANLVEKVRINPGNFVDKRIDLTQDEITDVEYQLEIKKIEDKLIPLLNICKEKNTALRIGVNHGSLSDRVMSRYGDTTIGMVESAMEFLRICVRENFLNVVVSLKSSNTRLMVQANRLMLAAMNNEGMNFPMHLGVTEAGEGEDGRIKSAVGIGALLADGIGDTVRVSLTEAPEEEIPVALKLVHHFSDRLNHSSIESVDKIPVDFFNFKKRETYFVENIGGHHVPVVIGGEKGNTLLIPDLVYLNNQVVSVSLDTDKKYMIDEKTWEQQNFNHNHVFPIFSGITSFYLSDKKSDVLNFIRVNTKSIDADELKKLTDQKNLVFILESNHQNAFADQRTAFFKLMNADCRIPVIIKRRYKENIVEDLQLKSASDLGGLFLDGMGDGIWIENLGKIDEQDIINTSFGILQASRVRTSKTEYISCPGCGRTLFDLQKTSQEIRKRTSQIKNLKIGIMGCIVNGPGEMADADYGYVGAGPGEITLYKNKEVIKKNIPEEKAVEELIQLIKDSGDWVD